MAQFGGALVADEVGLGKTYIVGEIMAGYAARRQRVLLVCPAVLRDTTWRSFLLHQDASRFVECLSFDQLGADLQPGAEAPRHLGRPLEEYALVVDEAHNYRNPAAPYRSAALARLLAGQRRDVLLLTATPVNNSLWDLYHLLRTVVCQDAALAERGILSIRERFKEAAATDPAALAGRHALRPGRARAG